MASDDAVVVVGSSVTASAQVPLAVAAAQGVLTGPGSTRQGINFWTDRRGQALHRGRDHGGASDVTDETMPDAPLPPSSSSSMNGGLASSTAPAASAWRRRRHRRVNAARQGTDGLFACTISGCTRRYKYGQHRHCCGWCSIGAHTDRCDHAWQKVQMKQWRGSIIISVCATEGCGRTAGQSHIHCCTQCAWSRGGQHTTHCQERQAVVLRRMRTSGVATSLTEIPYGASVEAVDGTTGTEGNENAQRTDTSRAYSSHCPLIIEVSDEDDGAQMDLNLIPPQSGATAEERGSVCGQSATNTVAVEVGSFYDLNDLD